MTTDTEKRLAEIRALHEKMKPIVYSEPIKRRCRRMARHEERGFLLAEIDRLQEEIASRKQFYWAAVDRATGPTDSNTHGGTDSNHGDKA